MAGALIVEPDFSRLAEEQARVNAARLNRNFLNGPDDEAADLVGVEESFPLQIHIAYEASDGEVSHRGVTVRQVWRERGALYFRGRCHLRRMDRTFRADRVQELVCGVTGEVVQNAEAWLLDLTTAPSLRPDPTAAALAALDVELQVLAYLARVDGLVEAEVESICSFVAAETPGIDRQQVRRFVERLRPTYYDLAKVVRELAKAPARWSKVRTMAARMFAADGVVSEDERIAWQEISGLAYSEPPGPRRPAATHEMTDGEVAEEVLARLGPQLAFKLNWSDGRVVISR